MSRYFFHLHNHAGEARDTEGCELESEDAARKEACRNIRSIICEEAMRGLIDLRGHLEVNDAQGKTVMMVPYKEAFELKLA